MARLDQGHVVISVDSASPTARSTHSHYLPAQQLILDNGQQLLRHLHRHRLKATWALSDPSGSPLVKMLQDSAHGSGTAQEVALIGDGDWVGASAGRTRFARELQRRVLAARQAGHDVQTLVLQGVTLDEGFDLLVKHRISVVRQDAAHSSRATRLADRKSGSFRPRSLRFGIWQAPPAYRFAQRRPWWTGGQSAGLKRMLRNAATHCEVVHIVIELDCLRTRDLSALDQWFRLLTKRQAENQVRVKSLGELAGMLNQPTRQRSSQSILRKAAG